MPFVSTHRRAPGRFLGWKLRLFAVGAVLLLIGMAREIDLLVLAAVALLAVAFVLRFFEREPAEETPADEDEHGDDEEYAEEIPASSDDPTRGPAARPLREERPVD